MLVQALMLMPARTCFFLVVFLAFSVFSSQAQQKSRLAPEIWPELQAEYVFRSTSFIYFRHQYRFTTNPEYNGLNAGILNDQLKRIQFRLGYEHIFTNKWGVGGSQMFSFEPNRKLLFTDVYIRHVSAIAGLQVIKRVMVDYLRYSNTPNAIGRLRPRLDVDKAIKINTSTIRFRAGYELFLNTDFKSGTHTSARRVDRTRFRLEISFQPNPYLTFTPYFTKQTDYTKTPDGIDEQTHLFVKGSNHNSITPIWGLEFRYTFFQGKEPFPRVTAPVQQD